MATVYSTGRTTFDQNDPADQVKANELGGRVRVAYATYEASSLASGDVVEMFALPDGARILSGLLGHDALASSTTLSVGHAAYTNSSSTVVALDADEYKAAAASTSAQIVDIAATLALGAFSEVDLDTSGDTKDNEFIVTVTMGGAAGTGTISVMMMYVLD